MSDYNEKKIGFYKEFRGDQFPSISETKNLEKRKIEIDERIISYLENGVWLYSFRTRFYCPITGDSIGRPFVYTDSEWFWTTEFIFYLKKYKINIPKEFLPKMKELKFKPPTEEELGKELINELTKKIKQEI